MEALVVVVGSRFIIIFMAVILFSSASASDELTQTQVLKNLLRARRSGLGFDEHVNPQEWSPPTISHQSFVEVLDSSAVQMQEEDLIKALPGQPKNVGFKQYGGHVTVDAKTGRALFYYFVEATEEADTKPLILWLNGGPGCSSLGYGAMQELGPFRVNPDGKTLHSNPFSWNHVANVLFLESPAGVGFSYSNTTSDYENSGDRITAADNYKFLLSWFERFPQYKNRNFYIAGESYAGNYIPQLATTILKYSSPSTSSINLKGVMIGNGVINRPTDEKGFIEYLWSHALMSDQTYEDILKYCNHSFDATQSSECEASYSRAGTEMGSINGYAIYYPLCSASSSTNLPSATTTTPAEAANGVAGTYDPCSGNYVRAYLNVPQVQNAMHANFTPDPVKWEKCSELDYSDQAPTVLTLYRQMMAGGLRILVYSGDVDSVVPVTSTRFSLNALKLPIETPWYPWMSGKDDVGGYTIVYKTGLTFATVRGAGHEVPSYQPGRALVMAKYFLAGKHLPSV
uniref:Carboxypeptidase n=1 Tax=Araucaria cunninghamii TaxID=56994 RepID=A0A0D6QS40_ARACU